MADVLLWLVPVALVVIGVVALAVRRRILVRVALRNVGRRKSQVAIAVAGLLVATSIISGSLVIGDTFDAAIKKAVFEAWDHVDELVTNGTEFPTAVVDDLRANLSRMPNVDAISGRLWLTAGATNPRTRLFEVRANLLGFDPVHDPGSFVLVGGSETSGSELAGSEVFVNRELAGRLEAQVGDTVQIERVGLVGNVTVRGVVENYGRGGFAGGPNLFLPLDASPALLGVGPVANAMLVSNVGGVEDGYLRTDAAVRELEDELGDPSWFIDAVKADGIRDAQEGAEQLTQLFSLLGTFTVIAGVMLIVNIFVMLAEERKPEMGISRALGLRRSHLTEVFTIEGFVYALGSAAIGAAAGLLVAWAVLTIIGTIFGSEGLDLALQFQPSSLILAFTWGFLLTIGTIALASVWVSRLNIVRAIRDIPEPIPRRATRAQLLVGGATLAIGIGLSAIGFPGQSALLFTSGVCFIALGLATLAMRLVSPRWAFTAAGAFIVAWSVLPIRVFPNVEPGIDLFIVTGLFLVAGGVMIAVQNSEILSGLSKLGAGRRTLEPVLRIAISYPLNKKFRTGLTLAMFALIIFTIVTLASIQALIGSSIGTFVEQNSGGYAVFGFASEPVPSFRTALQNSSVAAEVDYHEELLFGPPGRVAGPHDSEPRFYEVYGFDASFATRNVFSFFQLDPTYPDARTAWMAVLNNRSLAIVDRTVQPQNFGPSDVQLSLDVGDSLTVFDPLSRMHNVTVIGILDSQSLRGVFLTADLIQEQFFVSDPVVFLFKLRTGVDATTFGKDLQRDFLEYRMETFVIRAIVEDSVRTTNAFFDLLQGFLGMGLIVGIAGLGIVTLRNVVERRNEIGALRAIGFRRSMILKAFLIETTLVSLLGIVLGSLLGILLSYRIYTEFITFAARFEIPWLNILLVGAIAYGASLLTALSPSRRAAAMPPAQALRIFE